MPKLKPARVEYRVSYGAGPQLEEQMGNIIERIRPSHLAHRSRARETRVGIYESVYRQYCEIITALRILDDATKWKKDLKSPLSESLHAFVDDKKAMRAGSYYSGAKSLQLSLQAQASRVSSEFFKFGKMLRTQAGVGFGVRFGPEVEPQVEPQVVLNRFLTSYPVADRHPALEQAVRETGMLR
ncbi:hypothetical protein MKZ38_001656 [Zalerion maritima]|uniref:Uncharacterized protein n=1 Tax=Zalerion maritima TaxID=339359 RepID=A0AAD5WSZ1_9PEZI|nr:hypothetical protein MKZ38_001656 [Zalerion maritima]